MSRRLVRGAVALANGHPALEFDREQAKGWLFKRQSKPVLYIENLKTQLNFWTLDSVRQPNSVSPPQVRNIGTNQSGGPAQGPNPGRHTGPTGYLKADTLFCWHPKSLDEAWDILEAL